MNSSEPKKNIWNIVVPIMVILLIVFIVGVLYLFWSNINEPSYALQLIELNDSQGIQPTGYYTENYTIGQILKVSTLTEDDFKVFPKLAPIIRDKSQKPWSVDNEGRSVYSVDYWEEEHSAFTSRFGLFGCLEYKGKYYNFVFMHVD